MNEKNKDIWFSIIICCYNSQKYIEETLISVINQSYKKYEVILINDGSTDDTEKIIQKIIKNNVEINFKYIKNTNFGLAFARNKAIEFSQFQWIAILDHDDIWNLDKLEGQRKEIIANPNCNLFFSDFSYLGNRKKISRFAISKKYDNYYPYNLDLTIKNGSNALLARGCFIGSSTCVFKNKKNLVNFNLNYKFICDYDFFLNYSFSNDMFCSKNIYVKWRVHKDQSTNKLNYVLKKELKYFYYRYINSNNITIYIKCILFFKYLKLILKI